MRETCLVPVLHTVFMIISWLINALTTTAYYGHNHKKSNGRSEKQALQLKRVSDTNLGSVQNMAK